MSRLDSFHGVTGSIYALRRELAVPIPPDTLNDDMYLPLHAFLKGYRITFDEQAQARDYPTLLDAEFRRKVRTLAGVFQIMGKLPALLGPGNRMWFHFVSHKVARLLLPYALIAAAIQETGAQSKKDMGRVIATLKQKPEAGQLDFSVGEAGDQDQCCCCCCCAHLDTSSSGQLKGRGVRTPPLHQRQGVRADAGVSIMET